MGIGVFELLILLAAGWLLLKLFGRRGQSCPGASLKFLGAVAVVAGIAVLWSRHESHEHVSIEPANIDIHIDEPEFPPGFDSGGFLGSPSPVVPQVRVEQHGMPHWVLIALGSALIMLGAWCSAASEPGPWRSRR